MRKKLVIAILCIGAALLLIAGCSGGGDNNNNNNNRILTGTITNAFLSDFSTAEASLFQDSFLVDTQPIDAAGGFTFTTLTDNNNYVLEIRSTTDDFVRTFTTPFTISGNTELVIPVLRAAQLDDNFDVIAPAAGTATLAVFLTDQNGIPVGGQVQVDAELPVNDATPPIVVADFTPQTADVVITPTGGTEETVPSITFAANEIVVIVTPIEVVPGTVIGQVGTTALTEVFDAEIRQNNILVHPHTAVANIPFYFTGIAPGSGYTLQATAQDITVIYGPFTVPSNNTLEPIVFPTRTAAELAADNVPTPLPPIDNSATLVVYDDVRATVDNGTLSPDANPTYVTGISAGTHAVSITNGVQTINMNVTFAPNTVVIIRPNFPN